MKRLWKYSWMMLAVMAAGCSDSKDEPNVEPVTPVEPENPVEVIMPEINGKSFNAGDNFCLTMGVMHSGGVEYDPFYLSDGQHATITVMNDGNGVVKFTTDDFDFSSLNFNGVEGKIARPSFWGLGKTVSIPVELTTASKEEAGYYLANGSAVVNGVKLSLENVTITDKEFTGTMVMVKLPDFDNFPSYGLMETPVYKWITPKTTDGVGYDIPQLVTEWSSSAYSGEVANTVSSSDFMQVLLNTPFIASNDYGLGESESISVNNLFGEVLSELYFASNNIYIEGKYYSTKILGSDKTETDFLLYVDPYPFFHSYKRENITSAAGKLYAVIFNMLSPLNAEGIPMTYAFNNGNIDFEMGFKDESLSNEFVKALFLTILNDEGNRERLISELCKSAILSSYAEEITSLINNYKGLFENTTKASVAFRFI